MAYLELSAAVRRNGRQTVVLNKRTDRYGSCMVYFTFANPGEMLDAGMSCEISILDPGNTVLWATEWFGGPVIGDELEPPKRFPNRVGFGLDNCPELAAAQQARAVIQWRGGPTLGISVEDGT